MCSILSFFLVSDLLPVAMSSEGVGTSRYDVPPMPTIEDTWDFIQRSHRRNHTLNANYSTATSYVEPTRAILYGYNKKQHIIASAFSRILRQLSRRDVSVLAIENIDIEWIRELHTQLGISL